MCTVVRPAVCPGGGGPGWTSTLRWQFRQVTSGLSPPGCATSVTLPWRWAGYYLYSMGGAPVPARFWFCGARMCLPHSFPWLFLHQLLRQTPPRPHVCDMLPALAQPSPGSRHNAGARPRWWNSEQPHAGQAHPIYSALQWMNGPLVQMHLLVIYLLFNPQLNGFQK